MVQVLLFQSLPTPVLVTCKTETKEGPGTKLFNSRDNASRFSARQAGDKSTNALWVYNTIGDRVAPWHGPSDQGRELLSLLALFHPLHGLLVSHHV